ncbi:MAG: hypothetical protein IJV37_02450 [Bacteroidales bacterium]|nr:hypothetical protein [Bacteroidales bacterium]
MTSRILPLLFACLLLAAGGACSAAYADGYWVLDHTSLSKSDAKMPITGKPYWKSVSKHKAVHSSGVEFLWQDPPERIKFGDEQNLGFRITVNRDDDPEAHPGLKVIRGSVTVTALENGGTTEHDGYYYRWGASSYKSALLVRNPETDMHMDEFVPNRNSQLIIVIGGEQIAVTAGSTFRVAEGAGQYYFYKFVGDDPVYNYETEADDKPGEFGETKIPPAVFWGPVAAISGGIVLKRILQKRKKRKKEEGGEGPDDPEEEPKKPSSFRMILYKEFGDTLRVGDEPRIVGARIEELTADGERIDRRDLTETIRVVEGDNIQLLGTGTSGKYRVGRIQVPIPDSKTPLATKGSVIFVFEGPSGILRNHVVFKIEDNLRILFCQDNVTYVAGRRSEETIYFYVEGLSENASVEAVLENDKNKTFRLSKVRPDKEGSYSIDLSDCLPDDKIKERQPGDMDSSYLLVTAKEPVKDGERKVEERLPVHRFYEGLRMQVGHIKAYPVIKGTESIAMTEEQPRDYEYPLAIAHTRLEVTLFAWDEKENKIGCPAPDTMKITFADVPESLEWFGKRKEEPIREPVVNLGLQLKDFAVDRRPIVEGLRSLTYIYEIVPSAILVPPNRCKAAIKGEATFQGRTFKAEQISMVISMPVRIAADVGELSKMQKFDTQVTEKLMHMRNALLSRPQAAQLAALIYKCDIMLASFDERFGYYMPEFYNAKKLYLKLMTGEVGPLYVAESTYVWEEVYFGDGFDMCMATMAEREPKTLMGRLLLGIATLGYSEVLYYTPKEFLLECKKASENENATFFDNFLVGAKFASWEIAKSAAFKYGMQKGMEKLSTTQFGQALAETADLVKKDLLAVEQSLCRSYSSVAYVSKMARATHKALQWKIDIRQLCKDKLDLGKKMLANSPAMQELRDLAKEAQSLGELKVKKFIDACNKADISQQELQELVLSIQCDRWAKNYLNSSHVIDKYRFRFTTENTILHANVKKALKTKLAKEFGVPESEITFFEATGNASKVNAVNCKKVGMDHDYTIRVQGRDLPEEVAGRYWNDEYCYQATGSKNFSPWDADKLAFQAEQTAVSATGPESFGSDVGKVVTPKQSAETPFDNPELVQKVQSYKVEEPLRHFDDFMKKAAVEPDPAWAKAYRKEALHHLREAGRQFPKGMDRTLEEKIKILDQWGMAEKIDPAKLNAAKELRGRVENMLASTGEGDSQALIEFYASYAAEGKSLAGESRKAFSLITEVDSLIAQGKDLPEIGTFGLEMTGAHGIEEAFQEDTQFI